MKNSLIISGLLAGAAILSSGFAPLNINFAKQPDPAVVHWGGANKFVNGKMYFPFDGHGEFTLKNLKLDGPFSIEFAFNVKKTDTKNGRILFELKSADKKSSLLLYTHESGNGIFVIYNEKGKQKYYHHIPCDSLKTLNKTRKYKLNVAKDTATLFIDGFRVFSKPVSLKALLPAATFYIIRSKTEMELEKFSLTPYKAPAFEPIRIDFSKRPNNPSGPATKFGNGKMIFPMDGHADLHLQNLNINSPFAVEFKMQAKQADRKQSRIMLNFMSADKKTNVLLYSHESGAGMFTIFTENGKQKYYQHDSCDIMKTLNKVNQYRIEVSKKSIDFYLNGHLVYSKNVSAALFPVNRLAISRNKCELEISDLAITPVSEAQANAIKPIRFDFNGTPVYNKATWGPMTKFANGKMKFPMDGHADFVLRKLNLDKPFAIEFTMTPLQADRKQSRIMLHVISGKPKTDFLIYSHEKGMGFFRIYKENGVQRYYDFNGCDVMETLNTPRKFRFVVGENLVELYAGKKLIYSKPASLLPVTGINLSRNRCEVDFDDFNVVPVFEGKSDISDKPLPLPAEKKKTGETVKEENGDRVVKTAEFKVDNFFRNRSGAIAFWAALPESIWGRNLIICKDAKGQALSIRQERWETAVTIRRREGLQQYRFTLGMNPWRYGNGNHAFVVLTWKGTDIVLYVNGYPYSTIQYDCSRIPALTNPDLEGITTLEVHPWVTFRDLRIYQRPMTAKEIWQEYRSRMPIDIVMENQNLRAGKVCLKINAAPGGTHMHPMPVNEPVKKAPVFITAQLLSKDGSQILKTFETRAYNINSRTDIVFPEIDLPTGNYLFAVETFTPAGKFRRTFQIDAYAAKKEHKVATDADYQKGRLIYSTDFSKALPKMLGDYNKTTRCGKVCLEGNEKVFGTFGFEVSFPKEVFGKPVIVEIDWPDDRTRLAAHYIYRPSQGYCDRDRLQQGVQSGIEYPLSNKIITSRYLFWPGFNDYLFEFRNLGAERPAAVTAVRIYEVRDGKLPTLKINEPAGLPVRTFGHLDEDQTFYMNLNRDYYDTVAHKNYPNSDIFYMEELGKYAGYTGMNAFLYNLMRYWYVYYMNDTNVPPGFPPVKAGGLDYMLDVMEENGINSFICGLNISSIPEVAHSTVTRPDAVKIGWLRGDKTGRIDGGMFGSRSPNFTTNPEIMKFYENHLRELARILKPHKNVTGFALWTVPWGNINWGYDDFNVNLFSKETGIKVPNEKRFEFLNGPKRKEWLRWRADKTTRFVKMIADTIHEYNPEWNLYLFPHDYLAFVDPDTNQFQDNVDVAKDRKSKFYEILSMDLDALQKLDRVSFAPQVIPSHPGQAYYQQGRLQPGIERIFDLNSDRALFRANGKSKKLGAIYHDYYESMAIKGHSPTLKPEKYSCFFQDTDVKPHGRFFLKQFAAQLASSDAQNIVFGAQPLGALGREAEVREFAKAYRALPALPFKDVPGQADPVTVRSIETKNGTYFYLTSMLWTPCQVKIEFDGKVAQVRDLSTDKMISANTFALDVYQTRSFLIPGKNVKLRSFKTIVPESTKKFYAEKLNKLNAMLKQYIKVRGAQSAADVSSVLARAEKCCKAGAYAEAHRLIYSIIVQRFVKSGKNLKELADMQAMLNRGHWAVNCGSEEFFRGPSGDLFFPDTAYSKSAGYGYFGKHNVCKRNISGLRVAKNPKLFETEAWDIDGYRFNVPNGKYTVRVYMRFAYEPKLKPDVPLKFTLLAQNKTLFKELDLYKAMKGDIRNPVILDFKGVSVTNGTIELKCLTVANDSSIRHFNAIEIIREK